MVRLNFHYSQIILNKINGRYNIHSADSLKEGNIYFSMQHAAPISLHLKKLKKNEIHSLHLTFKNIIYR
jgi:hypothetical protein